MSLRCSQAGTCPPGALAKVEKALPYVLRSGRAACPPEPWRRWKRPALHKDANDIGAGDDKRLFGLEVADEDRRTLPGDHRRQELHRRRDVCERKGLLHDG